MSEYIAELQREWKRLGVPDPLANEMAADLAADLKEAEAEGVSPEEVLGNSAFDPRSLAEAWARECGIAVSSQGRRIQLSRRLIATAAAMVVLLLAAGVALPLLLTTSPPSTSHRAEVSRGPFTTAPSPVRTITAASLPDVVGLSSREAVAVLKDAGFLPRVHYLPSAKAHRGIVIDETPAAGTQMAPRSTVSVVVGR